MLEHTRMGRLRQKSSQQQQQQQCFIACFFILFVFVIPLLPLPSATLLSSIGTPNTRCLLVYFVAFQPCRVGFFELYIPFSLLSARRKKKVELGVGGWRLCLGF